MEENMSYKRILLKISGEALYNGGEKYDEKVFMDICNTLKNIRKENTEVAVVCGGGNIFRGKEISSTFQIEQTTGDYMGMLATVMNGLALQSYFNSHDLPAVAYSSFPITNILDHYTKRSALSSLKEGKVVILTGGVGSPFFTTDTGAALRALELDIECILMGKNGVEGVMDKDPRVNKDAKFIKKITYHQVLKDDLKVMDMTAISLLKDSSVEIRVFNMKDISNAYSIIKGEDIGTHIVNN